MRYVPNLIPEKYKVLKEYFKGDIYQQRKTNDVQTALSSFAGILFLLWSFISIHHLLLFWILVGLGLLMFPGIHRHIEKTFKFRLTTKIKSALFVFVLAGYIPLMFYYNKVDREAFSQLTLKNQTVATGKAQEKKKDQERLDSLNLYLQKVSTLEKDHKTEEASKQLSFAVNLVSTDEERKAVGREQNKIARIKILDLIKLGKYAVALPDLDQLIAQNTSDDTLLYSRAICYSKIGKIQQAVDNCKEAMQLGNADAEKLHNKINPIRRRVAYYVTRCCDGTTSDAKGRGACSWHGGVCNWNDPVYEEYRKYK